MATPALNGGFGEAIAAFAVGFAIAVFIAVMLRRWLGPIQSPQVRSVPQPLRDLYFAIIAFAIGFAVYCLGGI